MKQYYITSLYSQNLQVAVQQDHSLKRMFRDLIEDDVRNTPEFKIFYDYIHNHETTISLGVSQPTEILSIYSYMQFHKDVLQIPSGIFQEPSMNYTPTALSFVTNEKLSQPIMFEFRNILRDANIRSLYDITNSQSLENFNKTMFIDIDFDEKAHPIFKIKFLRRKFKSSQSEDLIPKKIDEDFLIQFYKENHEDDYLFHTNQSRHYSKEPKDWFEATYSLVEIVFLDMISRLNLKK